MQRAGGRRSCHALIPIIHSLISATLVTAREVLILIVAALADHYLDLLVADRLVHHLAGPGVEAQTGTQVTRLKVILAARFGLLVDQLVCFSCKVQDLAQLVLESRQETSGVTQAWLVALIDLILNLVQVFIVGIVPTRAQLTERPLRIDAAFCH